MGESCRLKIEEPTILVVACMIVRVPTRKGRQYRYVYDYDVQPDLRLIQIRYDAYNNVLFRRMKVILDQCEGIDNDLMSV